MTNHCDHVAAYYFHLCETASDVSLRVTFRRLCNHYYRLLLNA